MLLFPEAYALSGDFTKKGHFDKYDPSEIMNEIPCEKYAQDPSREDSMYQVYTLSCLAQQNDVALLTDIAAET